MLFFLTAFSTVLYFILFLLCTRMVNPATAFLKTHLFSFHHTQVPWKLAIISPFLACLFLSWIHSSIHFTDAETKAKLNQLPKVTVSKRGTKYVRHYYWDWECRNKQKRQKSLPPRSSPSSYFPHTTHHHYHHAGLSSTRHFYSRPIITHQRQWLQTFVLPSGPFPIPKGTSF